MSQDCNLKQEKPVTIGVAFLKILDTSPSNKLKTHQTIVVGAAPHGGAMHVMNGTRMIFAFRQ